MMGIKFFDDIDDDFLAGGKGFSLSKLYKNGFNVPNGYVIESSLFDDFLRKNNVEEKIHNLIDNCDADNQENLEKTSTEVCEIISDCVMDNEVVLNIISSFEKLDCEYVAVRSSANLEDGKDCAWAGQLESFLNVTREDIIDAVKNCWKSVFSPRAIFYRGKNAEKLGMSVAVVVQKMIQTEVSGVGFSINPTNNNFEEVVIEGVLGLGEAIVSGSVTPDTYIISQNKIVNKTIKSQKRKMVKIKGKNEWKDIENGDLQKLDDVKILDLASIIKNIENFYGFPVDVEWGVQNGEIYILQARPITTVKDNKMNEVISKVENVGNWQYYVSRKFIWFLENTQIYASDKMTQESLIGFNLALQNYLILNGDEYSLENDFEVTCRVLKEKFNEDLNFFEKFANKEIEIVEDIKGYINKLKGLNFKNFSLEQLYNELVCFNDVYVASCVPGFTRPDDFLELEVKSELEKMGFGEKEVEEIFSKIATCPSYLSVFYNDEPLDLLRIALKRKNGEDIEDCLNAHIDKYSWLKAPLAFEDVCFTREDYIERLENLENENIEEKISNILEIRQKDDVEYVRVLEKYKFSEKLVKLSKAIRDFILLRTYTTGYSDNLFYVARHSLFKAISERLDIQVEDLIMLGYEEILEIIKRGYVSSEDLKTVEDRRTGFAIIWIDGKVETYRGKDIFQLQAEIGKTYKISKKSDDGNIQGTVACPGKVVGKVKILLDYRDVTKVEKGDIIVATMTTPDYISAMEKASGFITDEGGITCHAAIISREFNVPCIVGTVNATEKLRDGQIVEMDAYSGIVKVI